MAWRNARKLLVNVVTKTWMLSCQGRGASDMKWLSQTVDSAELHYEYIQSFRDSSPISIASHITCTTTANAQELLLTLKYSDAVLVNADASEFYP